MRHGIVELRKVARGGRDYASDPRRVWMSLSAAQRAGVNLGRVAESIGPRARGLVYLGAYWGTVSTVHNVFVNVAPAGRDQWGRPVPRRAVWWEVAEENERDNGRVRRHCTPWDRRNQVLLMITDGTG